MRFLIILLKTNDEEMLQIHHDMLAICTRNSQEAKEKSDVINDTKNSLITTTQATARLTLQERLEAVTKGQKMEDDSKLIQEALDVLENISKSGDDENLLNKCKELQVSVCQRIPNVSEPSQLGKKKKIETKKLSRYLYCHFI